MDVSKYNRLIECVQFEDLFIRELKVNRFPVDTEEDKDLAADINMNIELQHFDQNALIASVHFLVESSLKDGNPLFYIDFEYVVTYSIEGLLEDEHVSSVEEANFFVERNVPLNVWPFAREFISEMTGRIGVPRLLIGMYRYIPGNKTGDKLND